jgi:acetolactate decarboxylase
MRKAGPRWVPATCLFTAMDLVGCNSSPAVHQVSTLQALMQGAYEGQVPCRDLPRFGTLGIGTFEDSDGELILLDGQVYQATADGRVTGAVRQGGSRGRFEKAVRAGRSCGGSPRRFMPASRASSAMALPNSPSPMLFASVSGLHRQCTTRTAAADQRPAAR